MLPVFDIAYTAINAEEVFCVDVLSDESQILVGRHTGLVEIWDLKSKKPSLIQSVTVCNLSVRAAKFVGTQNWVVAGSDDGHIRVYDLTTETPCCVHQFVAHSDIIRSIAVHPTQNIILTCSNDMIIKLWDWEQKWVCIKELKGHKDVVMQVVINTKDNNTFASASLDTTIKVWNLDSSSVTLEGHKNGVTCIDFFFREDTFYLISGANDGFVKIWDYQRRTCLQTLDSHSDSISCVAFHPNLLMILAGSADGTVSMWHGSSYRHANTLDYELKGVWTISCLRGLNNIAIGSENGCILIKMESANLPMSVDSSGNVIWANHKDLMRANIEDLFYQQIKDSETLATKYMMGSSEIYPCAIFQSPDGRFVVVCGDGEYIIYTTTAMHRKSSGQALEVVWRHDSFTYAVRNVNNVVVFENFKQLKSFEPDLQAEGIYGGFLLGVRSVRELTFYDWGSMVLVHQFQILPTLVSWNDSGKMLSIASKESFHLLCYDADAVKTAKEKPESVTEAGIKGAFDVIGDEVSESVCMCCWKGDWFFYVNSDNQLSYCIGGEIFRVALLGRVMSLMVYLPTEGMLYLEDKELNVVRYSLPRLILQYQTAIVKNDLNTANIIRKDLEPGQRTSVAHFLEKRELKHLAMETTCDVDHKFDLALQLEQLKVAYDLATEEECPEKWSQLTKCAIAFANKCIDHAQYSGGLILSTSSDENEDMVGNLREEAEKDGQNKITFPSSCVLRKFKQDENAVHQSEEQQPEPVEGHGHYIDGEKLTPLNQIQTNGNSSADETKEVVILSRKAWTIARQERGTDTNAEEEENNGEVEV